MKILLTFKHLFLIITLLSFGTFGCSDKTDCCTVIDVDVNIHYTNQEGKNLINSKSEFDKSGIKVYYKKGKNFEYIYIGNLDAPNMHRVYEDENGNLILRVYPSNYYEGNTSTTLIELNPNVTDTLRCEFDLGANREVCKKAWLNGVEMKDRFIKTVK